MQAEHEAEIVREIREQRHLGRAGFMNIVVSPRRRSTSNVASLTVGGPGGPFPRPCEWAAPRSRCGTLGRVTRESPVRAIPMGHPSQNPYDARSGLGTVDVTGRAVIVPAA